jgi:hypothetical protein
VQPSVEVGGDTVERVELDSIAALDEITVEEDGVIGFTEAMTSASRSIGNGRCLSPAPCILFGRISLLYGTWKYESNL